MKKMVLLLTMLLCMVVISAKEYTFYVGNALIIVLDNIPAMLRPYGTRMMIFGKGIDETEAICYVTGVYPFNADNPSNNLWVLETTYPQVSSGSAMSTYPVVYKYIVSNGDLITFSEYASITFKVKKVDYNVIVLDTQASE